MFERSDEKRAGLIPGVSFVQETCPRSRLIDLSFKVFLRRQQVVHASIIKNTWAALEFQDGGHFVSLEK